MRPLPRPARRYGRALYRQLRHPRRARAAAVPASRTAWRCVSSTAARWPTGTARTWPSQWGPAGPAGGTGAVQMWGQYMHAFVTAEVHDGVVFGHDAEAKLPSAPEAATTAGRSLTCSCCSSCVPCLRRSDSAASTAGSLGSRTGPAPGSSAEADTTPPYCPGGTVEQKRYSHSQSRHSADTTTCMDMDLQSWAVGRTQPVLAAGGTRGD